MDDEVLLRAENAVLKEKIASFARRLEELMLENQELRAASIVSSAGVEPEPVDAVDVRRRKIARAERAEGDLDNGRSASCDGEWVLATPRRTAKIKAKPSLNGDSQFKVSDRGSNNVKATNVEKSAHKTKVMQAIDANVMSIRKHIVDAKCNKFIVKQRAPNAPVKIIISDVNPIKQALKSAEVSYHEYMWAEEKSTCVIIRGLVGLNESELPELKEQLIMQGLPDTIELSFLLTGYMRKHPEKRHNQLVKLILPPKCDINLLHHIRSLNHVGVRFEKLKSKGIIQCINCQRFGHSAGGCSHKHRCVKCGDNHLRQECPRTTNKLHKLVCCNCSGEHTANSLTACSYFQERHAKAAEVHTVVKKQHIRKSATANNYNNINNNFNNFVNSKNSFADVAASGSAVRASGSENTANFAYGNDLRAKIDAIYQLVLAHERVIKKFINNA